MLTFDSVKLRLEREQSLSYMEFNYMMLQAYDFYELNKRHKCILQIGGYKSQCLKLTPNHQLSFYYYIFLLLALQQSC